MNFNAITDKDKKEINRKYPKKTGKKIVTGRKQASRAGSSRAKASKIKTK